MIGDLIAQNYDLLRGLHIISVIFWMAGLLYLPRLFVYHSSAEMGGELERTLLVQERRLLKIIMNPSMIVAFVLGLVLLHQAVLMNGMALWLMLKLALVFFLMGYHMMLAADRKKFERGERPKSEKTYRILNEVPPIAVIIIVLLATVQPF